MRNGVHGVTTETAKNLLLDAGKIVVNYLETDERDLGATLGGNTFNITNEIKDIRPDGAKGKTKGLRRITDVAVTLTVNMFEMTEENILLALPGAEATEVAGPPAYSEITRNRNLLDSDYVKNITYIGTISGKNEPVIITIFNALNDNGFELSSTDKEEAATEIAFAGHFDPAAMEAEPWEIRYPGA